MTDNFEEEVRSRLEHLKGEYGCSTDIDYEDGRAVISITYEDDSEMPSLAEPIEAVQGILGSDKSVRGDWNPDNGSYDIIVDSPAPQGKSL